MRQIERLEQQLISLPHNHPDVDAWVSTTIEILNQAFGQPSGQMHSKTKEFAFADSGLPSRIVPYGGHVDPQDRQQRYILKQEKRKALLAENGECRVPSKADVRRQTWVLHKRTRG